MGINKERILIILPRQLGDVLLGTPLAQVLRQHFPHAQIDWWAHPMAKQLLEGNPNLSNIFYYPVWKKRKDSSISLYQVLWQWLQFLFSSIIFVFKVRNQKYHIVVDAMNNPRTALQTLITGAKKRISFSTNPSRNFIYNHLLPRERLDHGYLGHSRLYLLEPLGIPYDTVGFLNINPLLPISFEDRNKVEIWLKNFQIAFRSSNLNDENKFIKYFVLSPTHRHAVRRWPGEHFVELGLKLIEETGYSIVWLWGPSEDSVVYPLHELLRQRLSKRGLDVQFSLFPPLFSLREAGVLSQMANAWVGNSNGLSHVAVAAGANTLELHGPTLPQSWCHPNHEKHKALQRNVGCTQCSNNICKLIRRECLEDLSVNEVFQEMKCFI